MNCDEATKLMDVYLDGELDPFASQTIEQHLRDCRNCERSYESHTALSHAIGRAAPYHKAPAALRERIQSSLRVEIGERPTRKLAPDAQPPLPIRQSELRTILFGTPWSWMALAAAIVFAAIVA